MKLAAGEVEREKRRVAGSQIERPPVLEPERDLAVPHRGDLGGAAVHQPEAGIVAGPADAVSRDFWDADDALDAVQEAYRRARKDRETAAHLRAGTLVAVAGGKEVDPAAVIARLDRVRAKYGNLVIAHGGGPGVDRTAARWAERSGVHQVVCKPDWEKHGRAAPFRRNDELLNLMPKGVIAFAGNGITGNLVDKARRMGIPVMAA